MRQLMAEHEKDADILLDEQWEKQLPANALYFVGTLVVCFLIVMLFLVALAH
jgi:hypothetical protein